MVLTGHGIDMLIFWIIFFEVAVLYFASSTLLRCRLATPKIAWAAYALMLMVDHEQRRCSRASSSVMMTSYVPMMAHWSFYLGLILVRRGALIACFIFFGTLVVAKREKDLPRLAAAGDLWRHHGRHHRGVSPSSGAIILIPTFRCPSGRSPGRSADLPHHLVGFGHSSQQINVAAHLDLVRRGRHRLWRQAAVRKRQPWRLPAVSCSCNCQCPPPAGRPGISTEWKVVNTSYFMYFAVLASMIHALSIPGAMEVAQRARLQQGSV